MARRSAYRELADKDLLERLQSILINAADGRRSVGDDAQFPDLRRELDRRKIGSPRFVNLHPTVDSFSAFIKGMQDKNERVSAVRDDFADLLGRTADEQQHYEAGAWTGVESAGTRLKRIRAALPLAQAAIEGLIAELSEPGANQGPILDHRTDAITQLRELHRTLGEMLVAIDNGQLTDQLGEGLAAEAVRYGKRAAKALRDDPMPYLASSLVLGLFSAFGWPGVGGHLAGVALTVQKHARRK